MHYRCLCKSSIAIPSERSAADPHDVLRLKNKNVFALQDLPDPRQSMRSSFHSGSVNVCPSSPFERYRRLHTCIVAPPLIGALTSNMEKTGREIWWEGDLVVICRALGVRPDVAVDSKCPQKLCCGVIWQWLGTLLRLWLQWFQTSFPLCMLRCRKQIRSVDANDLFLSWEFRLQDLSNDGHSYGKYVLDSNKHETTWPVL